MEEEVVWDWKNEKNEIMKWTATGITSTANTKSKVSTSSKDNTATLNATAAASIKKTTGAPIGAHIFEGLAALGEEMEKEQISKQ